MDAHHISGESQRRLLAVLQPPADQPGREGVQRAAARCLSSFAATVEWPGFTLQELVAEHACFEGPFLRPQSGLLHRRSSRYPTWALLLRLAEASDQTVFQLIGAALANALVDGKPIPARVAQAAFKVLNGAAGRQDRIRLARIVEEAKQRFSVCAAQTVVGGILYRDRLGGFYRSLDEYVGEHAHQCRGDRTTLSSERFVKAACEMRARVESGEARAIWLCVAALTGLPPELAGMIELCVGTENRDLSICVTSGTLRLDLDIPAPAARCAPGQETQVLPASRTLVRPLPVFLAQALRARLQDAQAPGKLANVLDCGCPESGELVGLSDCVGGFRPTLARFSRSTATFAVGNGIHRVAAAHLSGRYESAGRSKLYYAAVARGEIWGAAEQLFEAMGWGKPTPLVEGPACGALTVATDESVAQWFEWMRHEAEVRRPGRRYTLASLLEHHMHYTHLVASVLSFVVALRVVKPLPFMGDLDLETGLIELCDKRSPTVWNPTGDSALRSVTPFCRTAREQFGAWRRHCAAAARRLDKVGSGDTISLREHLSKVADGEHVPAFVVFDKRSGVRVLGSHDLEAWWPSWFARAGNWPRSYWQTKLLSEREPSSRIDLLMRHVQAGTRPLTSTESASVIKDIVALCLRQESILRSLGVQPASGLVK